ncbi:MAG: hypothetical protein QNJ09_11715 [Paracoccaceae bacterium]|nr:hypothetical protein [Paracoccaceae bacterium]
MRHGFLGWVLSGALSLGAGQGALACAFHGYTPDPTLVDLLLATEQVVTVRLDPGDARRYVPVRTLMGPEVAEIAISAGPDMRQRLKANPAQTVLLARDGAYGPWMEIAVLDARYRQVVERVVARQSAWLLGADQERLALFAKHLNDPNPDIRRLALQELDRAPYADLKKLRLPKVQNLRQDLSNGERDLMPIRVLLAGLSSDKGFGRVLATDLDTAVRSDVPYLGAYATALIELQGKAAVRHILERYLTTGTLPITTQERLLEALALHYKTGSSAMRRLIAREVAALVRERPTLAEPAARQFGFNTRVRPGQAGAGAQN